MLCPRKERLIEIYGIEKMRKLLEDQLRIEVRSVLPVFKCQEWFSELKKLRREIRYFNTRENVRERHLERKQISLARNG